MSVTLDDLAQSAGVTVGYRDLSEILGVSRMTLHRMRKAKELPPTVATSRRFVRWLSSDIELWLQRDCPKQAKISANFT